MAGGSEVSSITVRVSQCFPAADLLKLGLEAGPVGCFCNGCDLSTSQPRSAPRGVSRPLKTSLSSAKPRRDVDVSPPGPAPEPLNPGFQSSTGRPGGHSHFTGDEVSVGFQCHAGVTLATTLLNPCPPHPASLSTSIHFVPVYSSLPFYSPTELELPSHDPVHSQTGRDVCTSVNPLDSQGTSGYMCV
ncbi:unnamed protein product [Pleuronectes platessa]|uniref:Uncharacterized protein n=1 Tax=Pleuronectes platessa TaxID=8262 RepID=A0A9N7YCL1_PLEPL|nr:unnamed protein product [Pleuronectes platessa]